jgi:K+-transporting ATPase ATPase A chain
MVRQGVPMNFNPYIEVTTVVGNPQIIAQGPVAALNTIENLGTNGGGFFNVNNAHPYQNPTSISNLLEMLMIGCFGLGVVALAIAGCFKEQRCKPASLGALSTTSLTFAILLVGVMLIAGALSYFPALALSPIVEHLALGG